MKIAIQAVTDVSAGDQAAYGRVAMIAAEILAERAASPREREDVMQALRYAAWLAEEREVVLATA